ncbi:unnamed protein product [Mucor hiemalis]
MDRFKFTYDLITINPTTCLNLPLNSVWRPNPIALNMQPLTKKAYVQLKKKRYKDILIGDLYHYDPIAKILIRKPENARKRNIIRSFFQAVEGKIIQLIAFFYRLRIPNFPYDILFGNSAIEDRLDWPGDYGFARIFEDLNW